LAGLFGGLFCQNLNLLVHNDCSCLTPFALFAQQTFTVHGCFIEHWLFLAWICVVIFKLLKLYRRLCDRRLIIIIGETSHFPPSTPISSISARWCSSWQIWRSCYRFKCIYVEHIGIVYWKGVLFTKFVILLIFIIILDFCKSTLHFKPAHS